MWRSSNVTGVVFGSLNLFHRYQEHAERGHKLWVSCICDLILPVTNQEAHDRTGWDARKAEEKRVSGDPKAWRLHSPVVTHLSSWGWIVEPSYQQGTLLSKGGALQTAQKERLFFTEMLIYAVALLKSHWCWKKKRTVFFYFLQLKNCRYE